jgi:preprotein translocase subunit SecE
MIEKLKQFLADVSKEMKKVAWPTKEQLQESTIVVVVVCVVITAFVFAIDSAMNLLMKLMF